MNWEAKVQQRENFEQGKKARSLQAQRERDLERLRMQEEQEVKAHETLEEFGAVQALEDVRKDVWEEGNITQTINKRGWVLVSDPIEVLRLSYLRELNRKGSKVIESESGAISLEISVVFENGDPAMPKLVLRDNGGPIILKKSYLVKERTDMQSVLRRVGWERLAENIQRGVELNRPLPFIGGAEEVKDLGGEDASDRFNGSLIDVVNSRIHAFSLPGQVRDSWKPLINQFPHQHLLRMHGFLTVADMRAWEREVRGPNILERAGSLFSGKPSQPTKI